MHKKPRCLTFNSTCKYLKEVLFTIFPGIIVACRLSIFNSSMKKAENIINAFVLPGINSSRRQLRWEEDVWEKL